MDIDEFILDLGCVPAVAAFSLFSVLFFRRTLYLSLSAYLLLFVIWVFGCVLGFFLLPNMQKLMTHVVCRLSLRTWLLIFGQRSLITICPSVSLGLVQAVRLKSLTWHGASCYSLRDYAKHFKSKDLQVKRIIKYKYWQICLNFPFWVCTKSW